MKIVIGNDHGGVSLKNQIIEKLKDKYEFVNLGTDSEESVDYPDYAFKVANYLLDNKFDLGFLICKSGIGMSIAANKVKGIRAALIKDQSEAKLAKMHNKANMLVVGANYVSIDEACKIIDTYFATEFETRHQKRIDLIDKYENR